MYLIWNPFGPVCYVWSFLLILLVRFGMNATCNSLILSLDVRKNECNFHHLSFFSLPNCCWPALVQSQGLPIYHVTRDKGEGYFRFIKILHGGAPQSITILHRGRGGELKGGLKSYSGLHMFLGGAKRTHSDSYSEKCHEYVFLGEYAQITSTFHGGGFPEFIAILHRGWGGGGVGGVVGPHICIM